jgi:hypothetical protein
MTELPGLPSQPQEPRQLNDLEVCTLNLQVSITQIAQAITTANPNMSPEDGAAAIGEIVAKSLANIMHPGAAQLGLLVAFEQLHEAPMTFIDCENAKQALSQLAARRRKRDKITKGGVIIPGKD